MLLPERNEENGYRIYGEEVVKAMEKIQLMKYAYVITLHFDITEELMEYIQQICCPISVGLELRRREFLEFLE